MALKLSTGRVAQILDVPEPKLNDLVRREKVNPPPPVESGRRSWSVHHVVQAAAYLGIDVAGVESTLDEIGAAERSAS
jgi:hypothetical protein